MHGTGADVRAWVKQPAANLPAIGSRLTIPEMAAAQDISVSYFSRQYRLQKWNDANDPWPG